MTVFVLCLAGVILVALLLGMHLFGFASLNPALRTLDAQSWVTAKQAIDAAAPQTRKAAFVMLHHGNHVHAGLRRCDGAGHRRHL